ncbi:unnamed protein product, partial [Mesorhabditis spiculigera]
MTLFVAARLAQCTTAVWLSVARIVAVTCPIWWRNNGQPAVIPAAIGLITGATVVYTAIQPAAFQEIAADSWIAVAQVADPWLWAMVFVVGLGSTALHAIVAIALAVTLKRQGRPSTRPLLGALLAMAPKLYETWILVASGLQELHPVHLFWGLCFANFAYGALQQAGVTLCYSEQSQRMRDRRNWLVWRAGVRGTRPPREPRRPPRDTATTSV